MKSVFFLFFLVFIGFGFLLSDGMHTRGELSRIQQLNNQLAGENLVLRAERDRLLAGQAEKEQIIAGQQKAIEELTQAVAAVEEKNRQLTLANATLRAGVPVQGVLPDVRSILIFLPLLPASIAATYMIVRANRNGLRNKSDGIDNTKVSVRLTEQELKEVIRMRRLRR